MNQQIFEPVGRVLTQTLLRCDAQWKPSSELNRRLSPEEQAAFKEASDWLDVLRPKLHSLSDQDEPLKSQVALVDFLQAALHDSYQSRWKQLRLKRKVPWQQILSGFDKKPDISELPLSVSLRLFSTSASPKLWPAEISFYELVADMKTQALIEAMAVGYDLDDCLDDFLPEDYPDLVHGPQLKQILLERRQEFVDTDYTVPVETLFQKYEWNDFAERLRVFCCSLGKTIYGEQEEDADASPVKKSTSISDAEESEMPATQLPLQSPPRRGGKVNKQQVSRDPVELFSDVEMDALVEAAIRDEAIEVVPKHLLRRFDLLSPRLKTKKSSQDVSVEVPSQRAKKRSHVVETSDAEEQDQQRVLRSAPSHLPSNLPLRERGFQENVDENPFEDDEAPRPSERRRSEIPSADQTMNRSIHGNRVPGFTPGRDDAVGRLYEEHPSLLFSAGARRSGQKPAARVVRPSFFDDDDLEEEQEEEEEEEENEEREVRPHVGGRVSSQPVLEVRPHFGGRASSQPVLGLGSRHPLLEQSQTQRPLSVQRPLSSQPSLSSSATLNRSEYPGEFAVLGPDSASDHENDAPRPARRRKQPWSNYELALLERGIRRFGVGNWVKILKHFGSSETEGGFLPCRTPVDLKDKARNEKNHRMRKNLELGVFGRV